MRYVLDTTAFSAAMRREETLLKIYVKPALLNRVPIGKFNRARA